MGIHQPTADGYTPLLCDHFGDSVCTQSKLKQLQADFILPVCAIQDKSWCIKAINFTDGNGTSYQGKLLRSFASSTFPADESIGLPRGGTTSLWEYVDPLDQSEHVFAVNIRGDAIWVTGKPFFFQTIANIYPVKIVLGSQYVPDVSIQTQQGISTKIGMKCPNALFTDTGLCASKIDFPSDVQVSAAFIVPDIVTGFIAGRLDNAKIYSQPTDDENKLITVQGSAMRVPRLGLSLTKQEAETLLPNMAPLSSLNFRFVDSADGLKEIDQLRSIAKDTTSGFQNVWSFTILDSTNASNPISGLDSNGNPRIDYSSRCHIPASDLLGFVGTNAMVFDPGLPNFVNGEFIYSVGGMHFEPDGITPFIGKYRLEVSKAVASCLYGNDSVPIRASVQITSPNGADQQVMTETVQNEGNYYLVNIDGFNFSLPTVRVKFDYATQVTVAPSPAPGIDVGSFDIAKKLNDLQASVNDLTVQNADLKQQLLEAKSDSSAGSANVLGLRAQVNALTTQLKSLSNRLAKICAVKIRPKGC